MVSFPLTTVHWHGFIINYGVDGISGLEQPAILPGPARQDL